MEVLKTDTARLSEAVHDLTASIEELTRLAAPARTVVATIPPRSRRVRFSNGNHTDAVCFAVWSDGMISPIISANGHLITLDTEPADWTITGELA